MKVSLDVPFTGSAPAKQSRSPRLDGEWYRRGYFDDGTPLGAKAHRTVGLMRLRKAGLYCPGPRRGTVCKGHAGAG